MGYGDDPSAWVRTACLCGLEKQKEVLDFVDSIWRQHRGLKSAKEAEISKAEHARILRVLNGVAALSVETGPPVSNRDHDRYLYGRH
jgi:hypothetical protein